jgi:hypothetical protein
LASGTPAALQVIGRTTNDRGERIDEAYERVALALATVLRPLPRTPRLRRSTIEELATGVHDSIRRLTTPREGRS